ncbi:hypothetical protein [Roseicella frigidaeris]|uniref:Uncharacterized protein n=1 Tax=Roseicella frigidaeris TaxID=2230885 RepID=A0A327M5S0_9PROT|nr:hypothetical protein [Roseicella frigidaeris]RAI55408.1 hypothetical protein DOO78_23895 [Roseicella frigidaeris]
MSDPKPPPEAGAARPRGVSKGASRGAARAPASPGPAPARASAPADSAGFDAWLRHHLADLHAEVLLAPPPARFLEALGLRPRSDG